MRLFQGTNQQIQNLVFLLEAPMATDKPTGANARKGAVTKRTQLNNPLTKTLTKRNKKGGEFMAVKRAQRSSRVLGERSSGQATIGTYPHWDFCWMVLL